ISGLNHTPHAAAVYASWPSLPPVTQHSPPGGSLLLSWAGLSPADRASLLAHRCPPYMLPPHFVGDLNDLAELCPLRFFGEDVAFLRRSETALRRQAELVERSEFGCLVDAALDLVLLFERAALRGDQAEHDAFLALRQKPERLEAAGALGVVFEEI